MSPVTTRGFLGPLPCFECLDDPDMVAGWMVESCGGETVSVLQELIAPPRQTQLTNNFQYAGLVCLRASDCAICLMAMLNGPCIVSKRDLEHLIMHLHMVTYSTRDMSLLCGS